MSWLWVYVVFVCASISESVSTRGTHLYLNPLQPIAARVADLLPRLSFQQKIQQTYTTHTSSATAERLAANGVGGVKYESAFSCAEVADCVLKRNELQQLVLSKQGPHAVPISFVNEGLHGGAPTGTVFPMPVSQGCSWNQSLVRSIAQAISAEASAIGVDVVFAPVVNMMDDARFGRLQEGYSENPLLTSWLGAAAVRGLQGCSVNASAAECGPNSYLPPNAVVSLGKHFAAYGAAAGGLNGAPAEISNRTLFEIFLRPWKALAEAGVRAIMPSHNTVLGWPAHASDWLINGVFRDHFGFEGVALSDCNDIGVLRDFRIAANASHGAALGLRAGVDWDLQCGTDESSWSYNNLEQAITQGLVDKTVLDTIVAHVLTLKFANGLFDDRAIVNGTRAEIKARLDAQLNSQEHQTLAREAAEQSIVMLINKNSASLPWQGAHTLTQVALIGPTASAECNCSDAAVSLLGSYYLNPTPDVVTLDQGLHAVGIRTVWAGNIEASGGKPLTSDELSSRDKQAISDAVAAVSDPANQAAIVVLGDLSGHSCGEWGDRDDLVLQGAQLPLLQAVLEAADSSKHPIPVVVVLVHGRPQTFGPGSDGPGGLLSKIDALFAAWRPGQEFGHAMAALLIGRVSPSGKLAHSWPRSVGQVHSGAAPWLQPVVGKWASNKRGKHDDDGRWYDVYEASSNLDATPLFRFAHGLSYSSFVLVDLTIASHDPAAQVLWSVSVTVTNTGLFLADQIVQVYVQDPVGLPFVPFWKRLVGFARVRLPVKSSKQVLIEVLRDDVSQYSGAHEGPLRLTLYQGTYNVSVAFDSHTALLWKSIVV